MTAEMFDEIDADIKSSYAEKIAKLLRKAESTDNEHEAEALTSKAQQLMVTYAIDEAMLAQARGEQKQEEITTKRIAYFGIFQSALMDLGWVVATTNDCRGYLTKVTWEKPTHTDLVLCGFESDLARVALLDASLQIQCTTAMRNWWKLEDRSWYSKMEAFKAKREFIMGFASGVRLKLEQAKKAGHADAVKNEAARSNTTQQAASTGVELVLRSRQEQVKDWYDKKYGKSTRTVSRSYSSGGAAARDAGRAAGRTANTGTTGLTGGGKAISR